MTVGLQSHILIAACKSTELARELDGKGKFSNAFLRLLRSIGYQRLRYSDITKYLDEIGEKYVHLKLGTLDS